MGKFKMKGFPAHKGVKKPGPPRMGAHVFDVDTQMDKRVSYDDARAAEEAGEEVTYTNKEFIKRQKEKIANTKSPQVKAILEKQLAEMTRDHHKSMTPEYRKQVELDAIAQKEVEGEELKKSQKRRLAMAKRDDESYAGEGTGVLEKPHYSKLRSSSNLSDVDRELGGEKYQENYVDRSGSLQRERDKFATGRDQHYTGGADKSNLRTHESRVKYLRDKLGYNVSNEQFNEELRKLEEEKSNLDASFNI